MPWTGDGAWVASELRVDVEVGPASGADAETGVLAGGDTIRWSVTNRGDLPIELTSVALVWRLDVAGGPLRMFRHGYQSWSHSGVAVLGVDRDPSSAPGSLEMARGVHHADPAVAEPGELRSEWVTVVQAGNHSPRLVGFDGGRDHDGTLRLRTGPAGAELAAEAFLGGAVLAPGERRSLHTIVVSGPQPAGASELLEGWADWAGRVGGACTAAPYQVGWCSWYHYFHDVTEADLRSNLARAGDWPFEVFQLDDGYQAAIGDWLDTNARFASGVDELAAAIAAQGRIPGLWIAPFIAAPDSEVARRHPDWLARTDTGDPLPGMYNPPWGGGRGGFMWALDTTHPEVLSHLESVARQLVAVGYRYLKLDFTFAPTYPGRWHDPSATPAQRVRAGYDAIRRGAGADTFILGCGVPLAHVVGAADANRIGPDVAPSWNRDGDGVGLAGYEASLPATRHALHATLARSFMHRRLWVNDPDCLMLRSDQTALDAAASHTWSQAVGLSGGMALVSDDLALLGAGARRRLDEAIELGRASDAAAVQGDTPRCPDLMRHQGASQLTALGQHLVVDVPTGRSTVRPA